MLFFISKNNRADLNSEETQVSIDNVQHFYFSLINLLTEFIKKNTEWNEEIDESKLYFSPKYNNVFFASAIDGWGFGYLKLLKLQMTLIIKN